MPGDLLRLFLEGAPVPFKIEVTASASFLKSDALHTIPLQERDSSGGAVCGLVLNAYRIVFNTSPFLGACDA